MLCIGIRGGPNSFNEEAAKTHLPRIIPDSSFQLKYLYTTPDVFEALNKGDIDRGQFAIYNTLGGLYDESLYAVAQHTFRILDRHSPSFISNCQSLAI
jgi:prephenate dehydratase